jgi:DNA-binding transcriptional ArsR family regulator
VPTDEGPVLVALADGTRRAVFELVADAPRSVAEIAAALPISRPAVSQHLRVLKEARLVTVRPEGTRRIYSVDPQGLTAVREYLDRFWSTALAAYAREVGRTVPQPPEHEEQP